MISMRAAAYRLVSQGVIKEDDIRGYFTNDE